ncbi:DHHA1 domain protein [uncultured archaeon]|nr:DHHA1 domain protein [uncultured archaeon]
MAKVASSAKKPRTSPFSELKGRKSIITFHSLGDLDAAGSAIALQRYLGKKAIIAPPDTPSASARKLLAYTETETTIFSQAKRTPSDVIIVLDSSSPHLLSHLAGIEPDLMIDHHSRSGGEVAAKKTVNDPTASSTCEMLYFMLHPTDKISSIALLLGIISDSAGFQNATSRTFEAVSALLETSGVSYSQIKQLAFAPESLSERIEALRSCQSVRAERLGEHIVATAMAKSHEAHFAEMLVRMGADIAFVACEGEDGRISARMRESLRGRVRLEKIMFEIGKVLGGSGSGHELAAGASGGRENIRAALGICVKLSEQQLLSTENGKIKEIKW